MKLVIMTKSTFFVEEDKILTTLFEEGLENLHISKTDNSPLYIERLLKLIPSQYHKYITVHQHFYLKNEFSLAGIHLSSVDADIPSGYRGKISRDCSDSLRLKEARKKSNYVFLKNINDCIEYPKEKRNISDFELRELKRQGLINKNVYAMGGITLEDVPRIKELGFGGAVFCGDFWNHFDIHQDIDFKAIIAYFNELRRAVE